MLSLLDLVALYIAGVQAVFQPCIYPMIPVFLTYVMGVKSSKAWRSVSMLFFVLGLYLSFALYGIAAVFAANFVSKYLLLTIDVATLYTSVLIYALGLTMFTPLRELYTRAWIPRFKMKKGLPDSFILGFLMSIIAAPCAGSSILMALMIIFKSSTYQALNVLLALTGMGIFSLGLATPLILLSVLAGKMRKVYSRLSRSFIVKHGEEILGLVLVSFSFISVVSLGIESLIYAFLDKILGVTAFFSAIILLYMTATSAKAYKFLKNGIFLLLSGGFIMLSIDEALFALNHLEVFDYYEYSEFFPLLRIISYLLTSVGFAPIVPVNRAFILILTIGAMKNLEMGLLVLNIVFLVWNKIKGAIKIYPLLLFYSLLAIITLLENIYPELYLLKAFTGFILLPMLFQSRNALRNLEIILYNQSP